MDRREERESGSGEFRVFLVGGYELRPHLSATPGPQQPKPPTLPE